MSLALFERYPALAQRVPHAPILGGPTPVRRLADLERHLGTAEVWIKRDDLSARPYGGNKPRKLEFLLGAARARNARTLITFGGLGSNHALATALYGRHYGFAVTVVLVPQPVDNHVRQNLAALHAQGARLAYAPSDARAAAEAAASWLAAAARDRRRPYLIPPGGSSAVGALGYVSAGLEMAQQVADGVLPPPEAVFVASGSNGTAAGLLLGLRLAGLRTRLIVVRVSDRVRTDAAAVVRLANTTARLLARCHPGLRGPRFSPNDLELWHEYLGPGYGHPTAGAERAVKLVADTEGVGLEGVYTGKAMAALLDAVSSPDLRGRPVLFWNTYNSHPLAALPPSEGSPAPVPPPLRDLLGS